MIDEDLNLLDRETLEWLFDEADMSSTFDAWYTENITDGMTEQMVYDILPQPLKDLMIEYDLRWSQDNDGQ